MQLVEVCTAARTRAHDNAAQGGQREREGARQRLEQHRRAVEMKAVVAVESHQLGWAREGEVCVGGEREEVVLDGLHTQVLDFTAPAVAQSEEVVRVRTVPQEVGARLGLGECRLGAPGVHAAPVKGALVDALQASRQPCALR